MTLPLASNVVTIAFAEIQRRITREFDSVWIDADAAIPDGSEPHADTRHL
jgi:hypothetical protein